MSKSRTITAKAKAKTAAPTAVEAKVAKPKAEKPVGNTFTVAQLCKVEGKDPKTVRSRLRRLYDRDEAKVLPQPVANAKQRWTFTEAQREAVAALINGNDE